MKNEKYLNSISKIFKINFFDSQLLEGSKYFYMCKYIISPENKKESFYVKFMDNDFKYLGFDIIKDDDPSFEKMDDIFNRKYKSLTLLKTKNNYVYNS